MVKRYAFVGDGHVAPMSEESSEPGWIAQADYAALERKVQEQAERLMKENKDLKAENERLELENKKLRSHTAWLMAVTDES